MTLTDLPEVVRYVSIGVVFCGACYMLWTLVSGRKRMAELDAAIETNRQEVLKFTELVANQTSDIMQRANFGSLVLVVLADQRVAGDDKLEMIEYMAKERGLSTGGVLQ